MNYKLTIQVPTSQIHDFDRLLSIELELTMLFGDKHPVKGHDLDEEELKLFIDTDNATGAFELVKTALTPSELKTITASYREMNGEIDIVVWPK